MKHAAIFVLETTIFEKTHFGRTANIQQIFQAALWEHGLQLRKTQHNSVDTKSSLPKCTFASITRHLHFWEGTAALTSSEKKNKKKKEISLTLPWTQGVREYPRG